jgi:hypothetical protein
VDLTAFVNKALQAFKLLAAWASLPVTSGGRLFLGWGLNNGILKTANSSHSFPQVTWSQDGEDLLFLESFPEKGFYVDVGAHHPDRFSVTKFLYERGWHGINIDASPQFQELFDTWRPRDTNIESLVGNPRIEQFFEFEEPALSTLNAVRAKQLIEIGWKLRNQSEVQVRDLDAILLGHLPLNSTIDLLSIDVEGEELNLLSNLKWENWDIKSCLVEVVEPAYLVGEHPIAKLLSAKGLKLTRVWGRSYLFQKDFKSDKLNR